MKKSTFRNSVLLFECNSLLELLLPSLLENCSWVIQGRRNHWREWEVAAALACRVSCSIFILCRSLSSLGFMNSIARGKGINIHDFYQLVMGYCGAKPYCLELFTATCKINVQCPFLWSQWWARRWMWCWESTLPFSKMAAVEFTTWPVVAR